MRWLAGFVMQRRLNAILVTTIMSVIWVIFWPLIHLGAAAVGLVSLRLGLQQALTVLAGTSAAIILLGFLVGQGYAALAFLLVVGSVLWLPQLFFTQILRKTASMSVTLQTMAFSVVALVLVFYGMIGDPVSWWSSVLQPMTGRFEQQLAMSGIDIDMPTLIEKMSHVMTGVFAASVVLTSSVNVILARWWQALLYYPGGFAREFQALRLGKVLSGLAALLMLVSISLHNAFSLDILFVLGMCFFLQGMAVIHTVITRLDPAKRWLIIVTYVLLALLPQVILIIAILGWLDNWLDIRRRYPSQVNH